MPTGHLGTFSVGGTAGAGTSLNIISIKPPTAAVGVLAVPYLSLAKGSNIPYESLELYEGGEYEVVLADDNNTQVVDAADVTAGATFKKIMRTAATCIWVRPPSGVLTNGSQRSFSGIVKEENASEQVTGTRSTITLKVQVAGNVTITAGS